MTAPVSKPDLPLPSALVLNRPWRQFAPLAISLHRKLTVLVGPNGTGKSTLLSLLSLLHDSDGRGIDLGTQVSGSLLEGWFQFDDLEKNQPLVTPQSNSDGHYERHQTKDLQFVQAKTGPTYLGSKSGNASAHFSEIYSPVPGSFHEATKLLFGRGVAEGGVWLSLGDLLVPVGGSKGNRAFASSRQIVNFAALLDSKQGSWIKSLKRMWNNLQMFSAESGSLMRQRPERLVELIGEAGKAPKEVFARFKNLFLEVTGATAGIRGIHVTDGNLIAETNTGSFPFDAVSHGLAMIAVLLWDCVLLDAIYGRALVLIDEPENHLHPGLQRSLMATLVSEFESFQFVVATHSPFFVGAAKESSVCLLKFNEESYVVSRMLDAGDLDRGGTANDILRNALGVTTTRPLWLEDELKKKVAKYSKKKPTKELVDRLHADLKKAGQAELLPDAVRVLKKMQEGEVQE